jgi:hypothetical protein
MKKRSFFVFLASQGPINAPHGKIVKHMKKNTTQIIREVLASIDDLQLRLVHFASIVDDDTVKIQIQTKKFENLAAIEVIKILEESTKYIPLKRPVTVAVDPNDHDIELHKIVEYVKQELVPIIYHLNNDIKRITILSIIMLILSSLTLVLSIFFVGIEGTPGILIEQVFTIFTWVFSWTGLEKLIFDRPVLTNRQKNLKRLYSAKFILDI